MKGIARKHARSGDRHELVHGTLGDGHPAVNDGRRILGNGHSVVDIGHLGLHSGYRVRVLDGSGEGEGGKSESYHGREFEEHREAITD